MAESRRIRQEAWRLTIGEQLWELQAALRARETQWAVLSDYGLSEAFASDPAARHAAQG